MTKLALSKTKPSSSPIRNFCDRHGISETTFYRHRTEMPTAIKIGGQWRIPDTAEMQWLTAKEAEFQSTLPRAA